MSVNCFKEGNRKTNSITPHEKRRRTQWAGQFAVACELVRRGYTVAFTMGNTPVIDLMVRTPNYEQFWIDVKALTAPTNNAWPVRVKPSQPSLYYVFVLLAPLVQPGCQCGRDRFFVVRQSDVNSSIKSYQKSHRNDTKMPGVGLKAIRKFEDAWGTLPYSRHHAKNTRAAYPTGGSSCSPSLRTWRHIN